MCLIGHLIGSSSKQTEEEKRKQYLAEMELVEKKAENFEKPKFIGILAKEIEAIEKEHQISRITVGLTKLTASCEENKTVTVSYGKLGYQQLKESNLVPAACLLLLEIGSRYRIVTKNSELTNSLRPNDIKLKDPNPVPKKQQ
ncbi:MAG: hypothetical protein IKQ39_02075 [Oscillospiraceae bacterium]|nr:hypothetical protein [Oscillospiraceae bacterium]